MYLRNIAICSVMFFAISPAAFADNIAVLHEGRQKTIGGISLKNDTLCSVKRRIASKIGLSVNSFDLTHKGRAANGNSKLDDLGLRNGNMLQVKTVSRSSQC